MKTVDKTLANVVLAILLVSCYLLLPFTLTTAFTLPGIVSSYTHLIGLLRSGYHGMVSKYLHLIIIPTVLIALTAIYWIKSRRIDIANLLSLSELRARLEALQVGPRLLATNRALPGQASVYINRAWSWIKHCVDPKTAQELRLDTQMQRAAEEPGVGMQIIHEDDPIPEPEVLQEPLVEELEIIEAPARVRTEEEQRLHRCIDDLEALEAEGLPNTMTTEEAILLVMTRTAAATGKGVVCYGLSERHGPYNREHRPEIRQHQILQPHTLYYKLHISRGNVFRPDEPDCAICFSPLVSGEAMLTHDTCRRTFHEVCYAESLRRNTTCPFDRQRLVRRIGAHVHAPVVNLPGGGAAEQPVVNAPAPGPAQDIQAAIVPPPPLQVQPAQPVLNRAPQPQAPIPQPRAQGQPQPIQLRANRNPTVRTAPMFGRRPVVNYIRNGGTARQPTANPPALQPLQNDRPEVNQRQPHAQPPRRVQTLRGRPQLAAAIPLLAQEPADGNRPPPAGPQAQRPGNDRTQNNAPRNNGRPLNNERQSDTPRAQSGARRAWR